MLRSIFMKIFKAVIPGNLCIKLIHTHSNKINMQSYKFTGVQKLQERDYIGRIRFRSWFCVTA